MKPGYFGREILLSNILNWPDYNALQVAELERDCQVQVEIANHHHIAHIAVTRKSSALAVAMR
jgi:hypothetical protein